MWSNRVKTPFFLLLCIAFHASSLASQSSFILFSNVTHINKLFPNSSQPVPLIYNLIKAVALDIDVTYGHVYWTDITDKAIRRANIDGSGGVTDIITTSIGACDGIAVDWLTRRLYWTDSTYHFIQVSELDGSRRRVLIDSGLDKPRGIAVYPQADFMYWTDWGDNPKIERASLDGQSRVALITTDIKSPNEISIDYASNQIYWVDSYHDWLQTADLDGNSRRTLFQQNGLQPFGISVLNNRLYWTELVSRGLHVTDKISGRVVKSYYHVGKHPLGVATYDLLRQPQVSRSFMLVADNVAPAVYKINLDLPNHNRLILSVNETTAITYDPGDERIYWIDGLQRNIRRVFLNMTGEEAFVVHSVRPENLAVDWLGRHLYWTDAGTRRIEAARLDNGLQTSVIMDKLEKPRGLVLDPPNGQMYWTDWGSNPKIEKANMDGTSRWTLVDFELKWPNALTIDNTNSRIYWADAGKDRIESCNLLGGNRRIEYLGSGMHPFSLAYFRGYVYWSDIKSHSVQKLNLKSRKSEAYVKSISRPYGVFVYEPSQYLPATTMCGNGNTGCSHLCLIRHKGYTCACPSGYKLQEDRKTCERAREFVLFADGSAPSFNILPLDGSDHMWTPISILPSTSSPSDFDYDPVSDTFFWTDTNSGTVNSYSVESKVFKSLHRCNVDKPMGIAVDWLGSNIYWTDANKGVIEVSRTDGSMRRVLFKTPNVTAIVLNLKQGKMFISTCGTSPEIKTLYMDGSSDMALVNRGIICPTSLTLDHQSRRIYWIDVTKGVIESVYINGANREVLYLDRGVSPRGFALNGLNAFISDDKIGRIYRIGLHDKSNVTIASGLKKPTIVRYFNKTQIFNVTNTCSFNNGGCSDLCLLSTANNKRCACSSGGKLLADGKTCDHEPFAKKMEKRALLIADMDYQDIFKVPLDTKESFCSSIYDSFNPNYDIESRTTQPISITYNPSDKMLYWTDKKRKAVMRGTKDGSKVQVVARMGILYPDGIDVDYISHNVYWTDALRQRIEVSKLDGSDRKVLIGWSSLDKPGAIVVDPIAGRMYWTDYGTKPKIETSHMDGSNRKILIGVGLKLPTGLAIDFRLRRLYWADKGTGKIESISLQGDNRRIVYAISRQKSNEKRSPFGLAFNSGKLYWADVSTRSIYQLEIATGLLTVVANGLSRPVDVRVVGNMDMDIDTNQCSKRNGNCSNLCLPLPAPPGRRCACPEGVNIKDDDPLTCEGVNRCPPISRLKHGKVDDNCQNIPGGVCYVTCGVGFKLLGTTIMHCNDNGTWTARLPKCEAITCFPPLKPKYGRFDLAECNNGKQPVLYDVTCRYLCNTTLGFIRTGPPSTTCQANGMWTMSRIPASCRDHSPPIIGCPDNVVQDTDPGKPTALVNWTFPLVRDNADKNPVVYTIPRGIQSPHKFTAGNHWVVYTAQDTVGFKSVCNFQLTIQDKEPPKVVECQTNFTFMTKRQISRLYFAGINFSDNVGVTKVDFGNGTKVAWGSHQVTVKAYDAAGNTAECGIQVMVYSERCKVENPKHGYKACNSWRDGGVFCTIGCYRGYAVTQELQKIYFCSHSEQWINAKKYADGRSRLPDCSQIVGFTELSITGELCYDAERCLTSAVLRSIENKISQLLKKYLLSTLSSCVDKGSCTLGDISLSCSSKRGKRLSKRTVYNKEMKARFEIHVYLKKEVTADAINGTRHEIKTLISDGINISDVEMIIEGYAFKFDAKRGLRIHEIRGICGSGQVFKNELCVNCPVGHFHNSSTDNCERCAIDAYQEKEGQTTCTRCKAGLSTFGLVGCRDNAQCRECVDVEKADTKGQCEKWKKAGDCDNDKPEMFDSCPKTCGFCAAPGVVNKTKTKKQQGVNLKAVIPALVVPTVILVSIVLLVVILLRRKRRRREDENNKLPLDAMITKKVSLEKPNNDNYKCGMQIQQLHVRFEDKTPKKKNRNKIVKADKPSPIKTVLKKEKKNDDEEMYVRIPLKKTKVVLNDKKARKKKEEKRIPEEEEESEQISTSLELQEMSAQMDATQV